MMWTTCGQPEKGEREEKSDRYFEKGHKLNLTVVVKRFTHLSVETPGEERKPFGELRGELGLRAIQVVFELAA